MIDPDLKSEWVRHATGLGLAFCALAVFCILMELVNLPVALVFVFMLLLGTFVAWFFVGDIE